MTALSWTRVGPDGGDFALLLPESIKTPRRAVIFCPQAGGQGEFFLDPITGVMQDRARLFHRLAQLGYVCATGDLGGANTMGNDTATAAVKAVYDYLQTVPGVAPGRVHMVGTSMGNATATLFAYRYPGTVARIVSFFGLTHTAQLYAEDRGAMRAPIGSAWGTVYPAALPTRASPINVAAALAADGVGWRGWTAAGDPLVLASEGAAFAAAIGGVHTTLAVGGHDDVTLAQVPAELLDSYLGG